MRCKGVESEKESESRWKRIYRFDGGHRAATRLAPALVIVVVVVVALLAALLVVTPVTPGRGLVLDGGGFVVVLLLAVPQPPTDDDGLAGDVGGLSFCRLVMAFSWSSPAVATVRVLVVGFTGTFSCGLLSVSLDSAALSLAVVVIADSLTSTFALVLSTADVVVVFLAVEGFSSLGDMGVFPAFRGGSGSTSIGIPNSSSSVSSFSSSLPFPKSSNGLAQSSSIKVTGGTRFSIDVSIAVEPEGSSGFLEGMSGSSRGDDVLLTIRTRLSGPGVAGEYAGSIR